VEAAAPTLEEAPKVDSQEPALFEF